MILPAFVRLPQAVCSDAAAAARREWLVTNGLGGFAAGTVTGLPTRRYHGILIAALQPPLGRTLMVGALDETLSVGGRDYELAAARWADGTLAPRGFEHLLSFELDGTTPVWRYGCGDAVLEKRLWMEPGASTTYVTYTLRRGARAALRIKALVGYRDYHALCSAGDWRMQIAPIDDGLRVTAFDGATPFMLLSDRAEWRPCHEWYRDYRLAVETFRGLDDRTDLLCAGDALCELAEGQAVTFVATCEARAELDGAAARARRAAYEADLLSRAGNPADPCEAQLVLAADQFVVARALAGGGDGRSVIAGYPWFGDWGRDTMIALPGLTLETGRPEVAAKILRTFARFVDEGMLPNRFPDQGEVPEYNTVDATLWYVEAVRRYVDATQDEALLKDLLPVLRTIFERHREGTRYGIVLDPADHLLRAGEPGVQLTWMDAKVGDWVVTPRIGKPVEINALWYNALVAMADFEKRSGGRSQTYSDGAKKARAGMARFWNAERGCCFDVLDAPGGDDPSVRPNQLMAVALPASALSKEQQRGVFETCAARLYTPFGLRSLAPGERDYTGRYAGGPLQRDGAYHQGTGWGWLIGPFIDACLRVTGDKARARTYLEPLREHLCDHGLGSVSEIFDGDAPYTPRGCPAQAWSVAELLRAWRATAT